MRKHFLRNTIPLSLYSCDFYNDVAKNWKGVGASFLFFSVPVTALGTALILFNLYFGELKPLESAAGRIPDIKVVNGKLVEPSTPVCIEADGTKLLLIDPRVTGKAIESPARFKITAETISFPGSAKPVKLGMFNSNWSVKGPDVLPALKNLLLTTVGIMTLICLALEAPVRLFGATCAAAAGKLCRSPRQFSEIMRLMLLVSVPTSILSLCIQLIAITLRLPANVANQMSTLVWVFYVVAVFRSTRISIQLETTPVPTPKVDKSLTH